MDENKELNEIENNHFETADNEIPDGAVYDVFSENTATHIAKDETMNRDYLFQIYNEDMSCLNKEIRMTRTQYIKDLEDIEKNFQKQKRTHRIMVVFHIVLLVIGIIVGIQLLKDWKMFKDIFTERRGRGNLAAAGFFGTLGVGSIFLSLVQGIWFSYGNIKKVKQAERAHKKAIETLENRKKEFMMLGQYDSSR